MRVVLNSDVLFTGLLNSAADVPAHIEQFCHEVAAAGGVVVLPNTVLLELERRQAKLASERGAELTRAADQLGRAGIPVPEFDAAVLAKPTPWPELLAAMRIPFEIETPTLADYQDAERRACLHLPPHEPETKSDEMRDLVIWAVALRVAKRRGAAILVSRDGVHSGARGSDEAAGHGLRRASNFDEAVELLGRDSPSTKLAKDLLGLAWGRMRALGLPLPERPTIRKLSNASFKHDAAGHTMGSFTFAVKSAAGELSAHLDISQSAAGTVGIDLTAVTLDGLPWKTGSASSTIEGTLPILPGADAETLRELRGILEG